ncbi:26S proteasome subunit RPN7-domain-containing protein [Chiua virens]|nr:26S proteasome subunit RPN7-domain-containing protein [Chiua virens]
MRLCNLTLPQHVFVLLSPSLKHLHNKARNELLDGIKADRLEMVPYYRLVTSSGALVSDATFLDEMEKANEEELNRLDEWLAEAEKTEGESEISDALKARANHLTRTGDRERAIVAQKLALEKNPGLGSRIDISLALIRIGLFFGDNALITANLEKAENLGGDWDRRNRLKVHRGLHSVSIRQFKTGGELLLDALSTLTATELISYTDFVSLTVIVNMLTLKRPDLKKKLITTPDVISVLPELPVLGDLVNNLYDCHYAKLFVALSTLEQTYLLPSRLLSPHTRYYVREMRILAYSQLLESYRSVTLESLSGAFRVSVDFIDNKLSRYIANGRLHCTIDKVHRIVETMRPSLKNAQHEEVVKQGDILLNSMQIDTMFAYFDDAINVGRCLSTAIFTHILLPAAISHSDCGVMADSQLEACRHPIYWFNDGSVIVKVSNNQADEQGSIVLFRIHGCLLRRYSKAVLEQYSQGGWDVPAMIIPLAFGVHVQDFTALLVHVYHDTPLSLEAPFQHVAAILRVSSPEHRLSPFAHPSHLEEALSLTLRYEVTSVSIQPLCYLVMSNEWSPFLWRLPGNELADPKRPLLQSCDHNRFRAAT